MYNIQRGFNREEQEYNQFMLKLNTKILEVQKDFDQLSPVTQQRITNELQQFLNIKAMQELMRRFNQ